MQPVSGGLAATQQRCVLTVLVHPESKHTGALLQADAQHRHGMVLETDLIVKELIGYFDKTVWVYK